MPIIRVEMFKGRTRDQKRALVKEVTEAFLRTCGGTPESVQIVIVDVEKSDWGAAGVLHSDKG
jgi:4-oxalocrotonate tautomerase